MMIRTLLSSYSQKYRAILRKNYWQQELNDWFVDQFFYYDLCTSRKWILTLSQVRLSDYSFASIPILMDMAGDSSNRRDRTSWETISKKRAKYPGCVSDASFESPLEIFPLSQMSGD